MSAELLREAAALMRERAGKACASADDGWQVRLGWQVVGNGARVADVHTSQGHSSAEHIASWHPAVALSVATWLEGVAKTWWAGDQVEEMDALTVARAYLGSDQ